MPVIKAITKVSEAKYSFWDIYSVEELNTLQDGNVIGFINEKEVDFHQCNKSQLWEDIDNYVDELQRETELADEAYIVTYYKYLDGDLEHCVDFGITKEQIIKNVLDQKYTEGANYYYTSQLKKI